MPAMVVSITPPGRSHIASTQVKSCKNLLVVLSSSAAIEIARHLANLKPEFGHFLAILPARSAGFLWLTRRLLVFPVPIGNRTDAVKHLSNLPATIWYHLVIILSRLLLSLESDSPRFLTIGDCLDSDE